MFKNLLFLLFLLVIIMNASVLAGEGPIEHEVSMGCKLNLEYDIAIDEDNNLSIMTEMESFSIIEQYGNFNFSMQLWSGVSNISEVYQLGDYNLSLIFQEETGGQASVKQEGSGNRAVIRQSSSEEETREDD